MFASLLDQFSHRKVLVIGDVMVDEYIFGTVDRISPEAPVMVVKKRDHRIVPGGAANVAKNIVSLGGRAAVVGIVGEDLAGDQFLQSLAEIEGLDSKIRRVAGRPTTCKTRIVANHSHQVLRIDEEEDSELGGDAVQLLQNDVEDALSDCRAVLLSDYRKGVLTPDFCEAVIEKAKQKDIPVLANAKPASAKFFAGATLLTLNRKEAEELVGKKILDRTHALDVASSLRNDLRVKGVAVTLGDQGVVAAWEGGDIAVSAPKVEAYDVAGAGDTTISTLALGISVLGFDPKVFQLAVETSARVIQHIGVAVPTESDLVEIRALV